MICVRCLLSNQCWWYQIERELYLQAGFWLMLRQLSVRI